MGGEGESVSNTLLASWADRVGSLHFELWHKHRENVLSLNEQFSIAYGLGHRGGEVGDK